MLMTAEGEWIGACRGGKYDLNFSLLLNEGTLNSGEYVVLVDPIWHESAAFHPDYKKVLVDLYSPCPFAELQKMPQEDGLKVLS